MKMRRTAADLAALAQVVAERY